MEFCQEATDGHEWLCYKGFYTLEDALNYARNQIGPDYYIEPDTPVDMMQPNYELENQLQEKEVRKLKELTNILEERASSRYFEIQKLQVELASKDEELSQLMEANNDYLARIAKHMKLASHIVTRLLNAYQLG